MNQNVDSPNAAPLLIGKKVYKGLCLAYCRLCEAKLYEELKSDTIKQGRVERKCQSLQGRGRKEKNPEKRFNIRDLGFLKHVFINM